jgi:hypothetical protein
MTINMTRQEWEEEGIKRFGNNKYEWRFKCPLCGNVASTQDYFDNGAWESAVGRSCIGRYLPKEKSQRAFPCEGQGKFKKGKPCDYACWGLLNFNPIHLDDDTTWFEFGE